MPPELERPAVQRPTVVRDASATVELGPAPALLVRYAELTLKGANRDQFISRLRRNITRQVASISPVKIELLLSRMLVIPERRSDEVARKLQDVVGIKSISPVWKAPLDIEAIVALAREVLRDALTEFGDHPITFRVRTKRGWKGFPHTSTEFDRIVGDRVLAGASHIHVQLDDPDLTLGIDLRPDGAYVFARRLAGLGGLPVGASGRGLCLLSGGIDSPVAAWMVMRRGMWLSHVTFHSYPYIGDASKQKVIGLARELARYQPSARLYVVPFTECQTAIKDGAPESYRTVLYRRMMQRIAAQLCAKYDMKALVTGESLGQVASQTIENLTCIGAATALPVLRPLVGIDKDETITIARRIGTFELSNVQEPDCCTVFMPTRPIIHGRLDLCEQVESELDVAGLVERAMAGVEIVDFD